MRIPVIAILIALSGIALHADPLSNLSVVPCQGNCSPPDAERSFFTVTSDDPEFRLSDTASQKIISRKVDGNSCTVVLKSEQNNSLRYPVRNEYLESSRFINLSNPVIRKFAAEVLSSRDPVRDAEKIVSRFISDKQTGTPLLSSDSVVSLRAGDCKQHAVLLVAIPRAAEIPARAVTGLVFLPEYDGQKNVFVFHMWCEAYYRDHWVTADGALPGHDDLRYIALAYHSLKSDLPLDYAAAVSTVKNLAIRRGR